MYVVGYSYGDRAIPATANAFQATHTTAACAGTGWVGIACFYSSVTKLSADGSSVIYSTFLTGTFGSNIADIAIDSEGNALVAGSTNSSDFPTTPGALQENYVAAKPPPPRPITPHQPIYAPPSTGFVSLLNADGSGLLFSTFFSGTVAGFDHRDGATAECDPGRGRR